MALDNPPIQEKTTNTLGLFPQTWIRWFTNLRRQFNGRITWFDVSDLATQTTPISHTGGATTDITNDGLGPYTTSYNANGIPDLWDASTNSFDFAICNIGDIITIRFDLEVTTTVNNQEFDFLFRFAIGDPSEYMLKIHHEHYKSIGSYQVSFMGMMYIGSDVVRDNPAKLEFQSADNASIVVNGWLISKWSV